MLQFIKSIIFDASLLWSPTRTLRNFSWQEVIKQSPGLKSFRKERRKARQRQLINTFKSALLLTITVFNALLAFCYIPERFIDHFIFWLERFKFDDVRYAYSTISETLGATATIIGLGFVVIGFLFDVVKDKNQRTLEELFRVTYLYYVFAISIVSIAFLIFLNCFKYAEPPYVVKNFAVLASSLMLIDIIAIAFLFYRLLRLFNPEFLSEISSRQLLDLARFTLLEDKFTEASSKVYKEQLISMGFSEKFELASFMNKEAPTWSWQNIGNKTPVKFHDVHFPLLKLILSRYEKSKIKGFVAMKNGFDLRADHGILALDKEIKLKSWEQFGLRAAYIAIAPSRVTSEFDKMKTNLGKRLVKAGENGEQDTLNQSLEEIEKLYEVYYNSNK